MNRRIASGEFHLLCKPSIHLTTIFYYTNKTHQVYLNVTPNDKKFKSIGYTREHAQQ